MECKSSWKSRDPSGPSLCVCVFLMYVCFPVVFLSLWIVEFWKLESESDCSYFYTVSKHFKTLDALILSCLSPPLRLSHFVDLLFLTTFAFTPKLHVAWCFGGFVVFFFSGVNHSAVCVNDSSFLSFSSFSSPAGSSVLQIWSLSLRGYAAALLK